MARSHKIFWYAIRQIAEGLFMAFVIGVIFFIGTFMLLDAKMDGRAEVMISYQQMVPHVVQPGETWDDYYVSDPIHVIWMRNYRHELRVFNETEGYVAWTGWFHHDLITGAKLLIPATSAAAVGTE